MYGIPLDVIVLALALVLDLVCGELPNRFHPTVWMGKTISWAEKLAPKAPGGPTGLRRGRGAADTRPVGIGGLRSGAGVERHPPAGVPGRGSAAAENHLRGADAAPGGGGHTLFAAGKRHRRGAGRYAVAGQPGPVFAHGGAGNGGGGGVGVGKPHRQPGRGRCWPLPCSDCRGQWLTGLSIPWTA